MCSEEGTSITDAIKESAGDYFGAYNWTCEAARGKTLDHSLATQRHVPIYDRFIIPFRRSFMQQSIFHRAHEQLF